MDEIRIDGFYRHYKGNVYRVLNVATHTETGEQLVIYRRSYTDLPQGRPVKVWARPLSMFLEMVDGKPRFELIG